MPIVFQGNKGTGAPSPTSKTPGRASLSGKAPELFFPIWKESTLKGKKGNRFFAFRVDTYFFSEDKQGGKQEVTEVVSFDKYGGKNTMYQVILNLAMRKCVFGAQGNS